MMMMNHIAVHILVRPHPSTVEARNDKHTLIRDIHNKKVDVLHVRLTELHATHQNLPFPPNRALPLKQYEYQGRL